MKTFPLIKKINDNLLTEYAQLSSHLAIIGDLLRLLCLVFLASFIFSKKASSFSNFLLTYGMSSIFIGFFAYHHGHTGRGISEYISALAFLFFYMKY